jgi:hypothetical protein
VCINICICICIFRVRENRRNKGRVDLSLNVFKMFENCHLGNYSSCWENLTHFYLKYSCVQGVCETWSFGKPPKAEHAGHFWSFLLITNVRLLLLPPLAKWHQHVLPPLLLNSEHEAREGKGMRFAEACQPSEKNWENERIPEQLELWRDQLYTVASPPGLSSGQPGDHGAHIPALNQLSLSCWINMGSSWKAGGSWRMSAAELGPSHCWNPLTGRICLHQPSPIIIMAWLSQEMAVYKNRRDWVGTR